MCRQFSKDLCHIFTLISLKQSSWESSCRTLLNSYFVLGMYSIPFLIVLLFKYDIVSGCFFISNLILCQQILILNITQYLAFIFFISLLCLAILQILQIIIDLCRGMIYGNFNEGSLVRFLCIELKSYPNTLFTSYHNIIFWRSGLNLLQKFQFQPQKLLVLNLFPRLKNFLIFQFFAA